VDATTLAALANLFLAEPESAMTPWPNDSINQSSIQSLCYHHRAEQAIEEKHVIIILWAIVTGIVVGILSGLVGIAGGAVLVPILFYGFKMNQHLAQGTTLAVLLPPTGLLAFMKYYKAGNADLKIGLLIALGLFLGGYFGGHWAQRIPDLILRRIFALMLALLAVRMFFQK
jgi:uncharacterized membrane protein YfcA